MNYELKPRILVFGVGGAGGNAVDNMIEANLQGVEFIAANTDAQALSRSKAETRIQLGPVTTSGLGAGARPEIGEKAAEESIDEIKGYLEGSHMVFIAAGMGGGTGTGAAPVIARAAREMEILTVAVVTKPFGFEGNRRMHVAESGLDLIRGHVDTMIVVPNQNLFRIANDRTTFAEAFRMADDVLYSGVRGITDLMVMPGLINLDFADVSAIMHGMGTAMMGMGEATGENRALEAARQAIDNPLLDDVSMKGAKGVLINITGGYDMTLFELDEAANEIRREVDPEANIILGSAFDTELEGRLRVSVIAAGVEAAFAAKPAEPANPQATVRQPIAAPVEEPPAPEPELEAETEATEETVEVAVEDVAEEAPTHDEDRPTIITHRPTAAEAETASLEDDHYEASEGDEEVSADSVFSARREAPVADKPKADQGGSGFANLFGWRRNTPQGENDDAAEPAPIVSSPDDHPEPAPFDDADLEIPAFLRRSANH
ncbi:cell division protein FtsZ [uncultured Hyphomonas sp.]|uniref:cell division protein FtsZ n=1 Tax=uncultured Hyphomonas sp. TaxID=225298 RepID=UPI002AAAB075|nr:cell division protein FtsZ [uncultured Hyphomonas sp.]